MDKTQDWQNLFQLFVETSQKHVPVFNFILAINIIITILILPIWLISLVYSICKSRLYYLTSYSFVLMVLGILFTALFAVSKKYSNDILNGSNEILKEIETNPSNFYAKIARVIDPLKEKAQFIFILAVVYCFFVAVQLYLYHNVMITIDTPEFFQKHAPHLTFKTWSLGLYLFYLIDVVFILVFFSSVILAVQTGKDLVQNLKKTSNNPFF